MARTLGLPGLTLEYGGRWGVQHSLRLLHMVELLGEGMEYDRQVVELAAWLHDWGGYTKWIQPGVDHAARSAEVAADVLDRYDVQPAIIEKVLDAIRYHHGGPAGRCIESVLLTDADALDLLGVIGACRVFAMNSRDIQKGFEQVQKYRDISLAAITTAKARALAAERDKETRQILADFQRESFGMY